ncbi:UDP-glucose flavonoid 3-O-glucosyltransferase 7-like [Pistacia vera]|uniref:UDP-glucose flavonoid 3-O-glucosyltransferase 7-like n=1 Tax=Pistacia vera TaxID=55513 RepID=UPI001262CABC|nr:UDP-glucose flavonoid 3-O-glucosyltransferase 7-like [Pistacia vera]
MSHEPHRNIASDLQPFTIPGLPDQVNLTKLQLPSFIREASKNELAKILDQTLQAELKSYGFIINSCLELEPAYVEHYRKVMGRKAWHIGPISLSIRHAKDKEETEDKASTAQLAEIAAGLEASDSTFIWVYASNTEENKEWMPEGFEDRIEGKGLIIRECTQQLQILEHEAVGGFMTH